MSHDSAPAAERLGALQELFDSVPAELPRSVSDTARSVAQRFFLDDEERAFVPGERVGAYEIEDVLGLGGQAVVYEARDTRTDAVVALKVPHRRHLERMAREARMIAELEHPGIVKLLDVQLDHGRPHVALQLCMGGNLDAKLALFPRGLELEDVHRIASEILDALAFAHESGVVHRDVKPQNILFDGDGRTKIADFGIGVVSSTDSAFFSIDQTRGTRLAGTPLYLAPEQEEPSLRVDGRFDGRTDLFAFGKMLFVMLTGASPRTLRPPSRLREGLDPAWDDFVFLLTGERPEDRPADARAALAALPPRPVAEPVQAPEAARRATPTWTVDLPDRAPFGGTPEPAAPRRDREGPAMGAPVETAASGSATPRPTARPTTPRPRKPEAPTSDGSQLRSEARLGGRKPGGKGDPGITSSAQSRLAAADRRLFRGFVDEALRGYERALELAPEALDARLGQVRALLVLDRDAGAWAQRALEQHPDHEELQGALAIAALRAGDTEAGSAWIRQRWRPNRRGQTSWFVWLLRAEAWLVSEAGFQAAENAVVSALRAAPPEAVSLANAIAARALLRVGAKALDPAEAAVDADRENPHAWSTLGAAREACGDRDGATKAYQEAYRLDPTATKNRAVWQLAKSSTPDRLLAWWRRTFKGGPS